MVPARCFFMSRPPATVTGGKKGNAVEKKKNKAQEENKKEILQRQASSTAQENKEQEQDFGSTYRDYVTSHASAHYIYKLMQPCGEKKRGLSVELGEFRHFTILKYSMAGVYTGDCV